jgi:hypothetical protein
MELANWLVSLEPFSDYAPTRHLDPHASPDSPNFLRSSHGLGGSQLVLFLHITGPPASTNTSSWWGISSSSHPELSFSHWCISSFLTCLPWSALCQHPIVTTWTNLSLRPIPNGCEHRLTFCVGREQGLMVQEIAHTFVFHKTTFLFDGTSSLLCGTMYHNVCVRGGIRSPHVCLTAPKGWSILLNSLITLRL